MCPRGARGAGRRARVLTRLCSRGPVGDAGTAPYSRSGPCSPALGLALGRCAGVLWRYMGTTRTRTRCHAFTTRTQTDTGRAPDEGLAERTAFAQSCPSRLRCDFVYLLILRHHTHTHIRTQHTHTHNTHVRHGRLRVVRSARHGCGSARADYQATLCRVLRRVRGCIGGRLTPQQDVSDSSCCDACAVSLQEVLTSLTTFLRSPYSLALMLHIFFTPSVDSPRF